MLPTPRKRVLIIDGNFMMKRILRDYTFMIDPIKDHNGYLIDLSQHFAAEIERVKSFCDHVVICRDHHSWRKDVSIKPQIKLDEDGNLIKRDDSSNYKANRKETSDRDWKMIYETFSEFCECLQDKFDVPVIHEYGAEGDDAIWAAVSYYNRKKCKSAIYCTDSDINQCVVPSAVVLRRIKSKAAPEGEIIVHPKFWELYESQSSGIEDVFSYDVTKWATERQMFDNKTLGNGIELCYPYWKVLCLMVCGSAKDNVFELFNWPAKSVTRHIGVKHIQEALAVMGIKKTDLTLEHIYDEAFLKTLIINICYSTGQTQYIPHLQYLYECICQNRKLNFLSEKEIPHQVQVNLFNSLDYQCLMEPSFERLSKWNLIAEALGVSGDKTFAKLGI